MLVFDRDNWRFNFRVAAVCIRDGHVLLERERGFVFWTPPGGRVEQGEATDEALRRELNEELQADVPIDRLLWVVENFFALGGRDFHELAFYYAVTLPDDSDYVEIGRDYSRTDAGHIIDIRWWSLDEIDGIGVVPSFLIEGLRSLPSVPLRVVQRG